MANSQEAGTGAPVPIGLGTTFLYIDNPGALSPSSCNSHIFPLSSLPLHAESVNTSRTATKHIANQIVEERVLLQKPSNTLELELQQSWKPGLWAHQGWVPQPWHGDKAPRSCSEATFRNDPCQLPPAYIQGLPRILAPSSLLQQLSPNILCYLPKTQF